MKDPSTSVQVFFPVKSTCYTVDQTAMMAGISRRTVMVYCKYQLVTCVVDPGFGRYLFDGQTVSLLRRLEAIREILGLSILGLKMTLNLVAEMSRPNVSVTFGA